MIAFYLNEHDLKEEYSNIPFFSTPLIDWFEVPTSVLQKADVVFYARETAKQKHSASITRIPKSKASEPVLGLSSSLEIISDYKAISERDSQTLHEIISEMFISSCSAMVSDEDFSSQQNLDEAKAFSLTLAEE